MNGLSNHEISERIAVLEERMKTNYAETESALDRLRADMANWKADMAQRDVEAGKRENRQLLATIVIVGMGTAILGVLITAQ